MSPEPVQQDRLSCCPGGESMADEEPRPSVDASWITTVTIKDGPSGAAIYGVALLTLAAIVALAILVG